MWLSGAPINARAANPLRKRAAALNSAGLSFMSIKSCRKTLAEEIGRVL
jgi:hypothetical protein